MRIENIPEVETKGEGSEWERKKRNWKYIVGTYMEVEIEMESKYIFVIGMAQAIFRPWTRFWIGFLLFPKDL